MELQLLIVNPQWSGSTPRCQEGGGWSICKRTRSRLHGDIGQDCSQCGGGLHQHSQGDLRQDPGGRLRHQQWGERDQVGSPAQPCWWGSCRSRGSVWGFGGLLLNNCSLCTNGDPGLLVVVNNPVFLAVARGGLRHWVYVCESLIRVGEALEFTTAMCRATLIQIFI